MFSEYIRFQRAFEIEHSELDTQRFSVRVGRCTVSTNSAASDSEILGKIRESDHEIVVLRFPTSRTSLSRALSNHFPNAFLADKLRYFVKELRDSSVKGGSDCQGQVRIATVEDSWALKGIAESAFRDYISHYSANSRISKVKILEGYADWAVRQLHDASVVLVAVNDDGDIDGFLSLQINDGIAEIVLNAVGRHAQGTGVYKRLLKHAQEFATNTKCTEIVTSTQTTNERIIHIWESNGYIESLMLETWHINL